tara:strand:+ start:219 stop:584 length:366 start_codon:yes stop_codon:yes gene_type:complete
MWKSKDSYSMWGGSDLLDKRKSLGMSQLVMSSSLGVSHRMYCYYESGQQQIPRSIELSVRWMERSSSDVTEPPSGSLSDFDRERIDRLCDALVGIEGFDADSDRVLSQSLKEIEYLLSKFD